VDAGSPEAAATPQPAAALGDGGAPKVLAWDERLSFGIRAEYAFPLGTGVAGPLSDVVAGAFLIGGEIGYLVAPHLTLSAYFFYGFPTIAGGSSSTCSDPTLECSANLIRFGAVANYHFNPYNKLVEPWVGLGIGYEVLNVTSEDCTGAEQGATSLNGFELSTAVGAEFRPWGNFGLGPYLQGSVGHYFADVSPPAFHGWLTLGARIRMGP
jgi:hypothetical protein